MPKNGKTQKSTRQTNVATQTVTTPSLPDISDQFKRAWELYKLHLLDFFKVWLLGVAILITLLLGLGLVVAIIYGAWLIQAVKIIPPLWLVVLGGVIFLAYLLVATMVNLGLQATFITLASNKTKKREDVFKTFKKGLRFAPYLLVLSFIQLFFFGSFWMLIVPWIFIIFLTAFAQYEVVLNQQKPWQAVKNSFSLVSQFAGGVVGRLILLGLGSGIITSLYQQLAVGIMSQTDSPSLALFHLVAQPVFNVLVSWFVLTFSLTLYQDVKSKAKVKKQVSTRWAVVLSVVGWLFFIVTGYFVVTALITHWHNLLNTIQQLVSVF